MKRFGCSAIYSTSQVKADQATCKDRHTIAASKTSPLGRFDGQQNSYGSIDLTEKGSSQSDDDGGAKGANILCSDIIGNFGWFQFLVLLFSGLRECCVGYDALVMSVILQPVDNFLCVDRPARDYQLSGVTNASSQYNQTLQCFQSINGQVLEDHEGDPIKCNRWIFPDYEPARNQQISNLQTHPPAGQSNSVGRFEAEASLVAEWSLVCQRHWLVAFIESAYFFGLVTGNLMWGYYADQVGRRKAYLFAHWIALIFGWASVFVPTVELFVLCRFLTAFGSIGYNIIYSIQIEIIGTKYRSFSTILNHLGWGLGVIFIPLADRLVSHYQYLIMVAPVLTTLMLPWAYWLPESSRWLMTNNQFQRARQELIRAAKFNGKKFLPLMDKSVSALNKKITNDRLQADRSSTDMKHPYRTLFCNPKLARDTILLAYMSFCGHLFYYVLTINFAYMKNLSTEANFIISGAGEWVCVVLGALMLRLCSRKNCMSLCMLLMSASFLFQTLVDADLAPNFDTPASITANNAVGTLSALLLVFITLIVNQEVYPTVLRQTGSSIVNTLGESGSTLAPLLIQLGRVLGLWRADLLFASVCAFGMVCIQFVSKTDDIELADT